MLPERLDSNISVLCCIASLAFSFFLIVCIALYSCCCKESKQQEPRVYTKYLSRESTEMLVYCNSLLYGLPNYQLNKLQRVLNASARLVCNAPRFCHISPLLRGLHWLPVKAQIQFKILPVLRSKQFKALLLNIYAIY